MSTQFGYQPSLTSKFFPPVRREIHASVDKSRKVRDAILAAPRISTTSAGRVVRMACIMFGISEADLRGPGRAWPLVAARQYAVVRLRQPPLSLSTTVIGRILNRDHTSILNLASHSQSSLPPLQAWDQIVRRVGYFFFQRKMDTSDIGTLLWMKEADVLRHLAAFRWRRR